MKSLRRPIRAIVSGAILIVVNAVVNAGSFSLYTESSPAAVGNYAAGVAAEAADASIGWYNPAGLSLIHEREAVGGLVALAPSLRLTGASTYTTLGLPPYTQTFHNINGAKMGYVPSAHFALPVGENTTLGLSLVAPFGLSTQWNRLSSVRYEATTSYLVTANLSPEIGSRLNEHFAVGAGIDLQHAHVRLNEVLGAPALMNAVGLPPTFLDSLSYNKGHSFGVGFHAGLMALFNEDHTRIGLNYQSQVRHRFNGYSRLQGRLANLNPIIAPITLLTANPDAIFWGKDLASNTIILPEIATLSAYQDVNERLALLASVVYTGWKSIKTIELDRLAAYAPGLGQVFVNTIIAENYRNTWRFSLGANYDINEHWMIRVGGGYDGTPTRNRYRDVRVPDCNRWAAAVGTHYQLRPELGIDFGYYRLIEAGHSRINRTDTVGPTSQYNVHASVKAYANVFALQAVWTLDQPVVVATK